MKQLSLALNIVLLILVAILFYLHFNSKKTPPPTVKKEVPVDSQSAPQIAYFEMDSLQANYSYFKDALSQLHSKEQSMNAQLAGLERSYQKKVTEWQQKGPSMSQSEAEAAQRENAQLQQNYQRTKQALEEAYAKQSMDFKKDIKLRIEQFLKDYNKDNRYAYVLSYEPDFIFYKDSSLNITSDLVSGLNATYKKKD
jgi:outer membrane protein